MNDSETNTVYPIVDTTPSTGSVGAVRSRRAAADPVLVFDRVSKWYGPVIGLNEVSLELRAGITGLVGPNGAGKSTLMKLATGQLKPDIGEVLILGRSAWSAAAKAQLGYCPESDAFYEEMSGRRFIRTMARLCGYAASEANDRTELALRRVGMAERSNLKLRGYSKGMRQRIKLAQSLVHDPRLLILDEPLNGVDPVGRVDLAGLFHELADAGKALLISSHLLDELERITDRIVVISRGRLAAQGTLAEIRDLLENYPLAIRVGTDRPRELAAALLQMPDTLGVELESFGRLVARVRNAPRFFAAFGVLVAQQTYQIELLEQLDSSAQAIVDYLLKEGI